eukprot:scaffold742_cov395-Prasinococcus_capsulatus_cf.AAC.10
MQEEGIARHSAIDSNHYPTRRYIDFQRNGNEGRAPNFRTRLPRHIRSHKERGERAQGKHIRCVPQ